MNIDILTRKLGGYTNDNFAKAEEIYRKQVADFLQDNKSFMIESNLAKENEYEWIGAMIRKGYEIILFYLCTDYVEEVHINRVHKRVREGGHDVPSNIIEHRYTMSLLYLRSKLHLFKEAYLIDNTETANIIAVLKYGMIESKKQNCPLWIQQVTYIAERLQRKGKQQL